MKLYSSLIRYRWCRTCNMVHVPVAVNQCGPKQTVTNQVKVPHDKSVKSHWRERLNLLGWCRKHTDFCALRDNKCADDVLFKILRNNLVHEGNDLLQWFWNTLYGQKYLVWLHLLGGPCSHGGGSRVGTWLYMNQLLIEFEEVDVPLKNVGRWTNRNLSFSLEVLGMNRIE